MLGVTEFKVKDCKFFSMGKELKNEHFIYTYDIADQMTIQAMLRKVDSIISTTVNSGPRNPKTPKPQWAYR